MADQPSLSDPPTSTEVVRRRRGRSWAILLALLALCALFYAITIVKMAHL